MAEVLFTHSGIGSLGVSTKPDLIQWSYGLNTANYPTYGGEVVQILSAFIDDMTVAGTISTYAELERIYSYFLTYIQQATQGETGTGSYQIEPVQFLYPERGWEFSIIPKGLPSFKYGRDVVAPIWTMLAHVADPAQEVLAEIVDEAIFKQRHEGDFDVFGTATADIGYKADNPFSGITAKGEDDVDGNIDVLGDFYNDLIRKYTENNFEDLSADFSKPAFLHGDAIGPTDGSTTDDTTRDHAEEGRKKK